MIKGRGTGGNPQPHCLYGTFHSPGGADYCRTFGCVSVVVDIGEKMKQKVLTIVLEANLVFDSREGLSLLGWS
jgi:hypothetical protein